MNALGEPTRSAAVEGLLAEGLTTLLNQAELAPDLLSRIADTASVTAAAASEDATTHTDIGPEPDLWLPSMQPPYIDPTIADAALLDAELRGLSADLMRRDLRLGELGLEAERCRLASIHGYRTVDDLFREALGVAPSSMAARAGPSGRRIATLEGDHRGRVDRLRDRNPARAHRWSRD